MQGRRMRPFVPWATVTVMTALAIGAAIVAATTTTPTSIHSAAHSKSSNPFHTAQVIAPDSGLGGYTRLGAVSQLSAAWRVPTIAAGSEPGAGATWVGAQFGQRSFIQLGTVENKPAHAGDPITYEAFWSDIDVNYHALFLGNVQAGDLVTAQMTHANAGWTLHFTDVTTPLNRTTHTVYGAHTTYDLSEWIQEDPAPGSLTSTDVPYPDLSPTTMAFLLVNHQAPSADSLIPSALVTQGGGSFIPTPLHSDTFTFVRPTGYAAQYLNDASLVNAAEYQFDVKLDNWNALSSNDQYTSAAALTDAIAAFKNQLAKQLWPPKTHSDIVYAENITTKELASLDRWVAAGLSVKDRNLLQAIDDPRLQIATDAIRHDVGLPPSS